MAKSKTADRSPTVAVIGLSGYAATHLNAVEWLEQQAAARLAAVIALPEDQAANPERMQALNARGIAIFPSIDAYFDNRRAEIDILTVPIGIHEHVPISVRAMHAGMHVYCEKPIAATMQEARQLISAQQKTGKKVAIGYQHLYSHSIAELKARVCDGRLGQPQDIRLMCGWPRSREYYSRNAWAGKLKAGGAWILDSPANNAVSHYLMNTLYLATTTDRAAARPAKLQAQLYRANAIQSADLAQIQYRTEEGARVFIHFAHCNGFQNGPRMVLTCENGSAVWEHDQGATEVKTRDGEISRFNNDTHAEWRFDGFLDLVNAIRRDEEPLCTPGVAVCQTLAINAMHDSCPEIKSIGKEHLQEVEDWEMWPPDKRGQFCRVKNLDNLLTRAFDESKWFAELNVPWAIARPPLEIETENYKDFPGGTEPH